MAGTVSVFPDVKTARGGTGDYCVVIHRELFLLAPRLHNQFQFFSQDLFSINFILKLNLWNLSINFFYLFLKLFVQIILEIVFIMQLCFGLQWTRIAVFRTRSRQSCQKIKKKKRDGPQDMGLLCYGPQDNAQFQTP